jgi:adenylylsulfate kinase
LSDLNITWHSGGIAREAREDLLGQRGCTVWFTGLSASGKSTLAVALEEQLSAMGRLSYRLDGDNLRHGLNANLGFSAEDRAENIRRVGEVARLFADCGVITLSSFISPYAVDRAGVRAMHQAAGLDYLEVFVDCPLAVAEGRDPKGLYAKARAGQLRGFTGIDDPYEPPEAPELHLRTDQEDIPTCVARLIGLLQARSVLRRA